MPALSFGLMDEDYWSQPRLNLKATQTKAKEMDFLGILLEGPQVVDLERRSTLPLIGLRRATIEDNFHLRHDSHAVIAAISGRDNSVFAAPAFRNKSETKEDYTPPKEGFQEGTRMSAFDIDARERLPDLPWGPGKWTFTLYLFDQQSNPVFVELRAENASEVSTVGAEASQPRSIRPASDAKDGHAFAKSAESPDLPKHEGIALRMDQKEIAHESRTCMLRGSFRLKALPGERFDARSGITAPVGAEGAQAIVPITLLLLGKEIAGPYLFTIHAPARTSSVQGLVEGYFHVNLLQMPESFGIPQVYVARALHGQAQSEVVKFEIEKSANRP